MAKKFVVSDDSVLNDRGFRVLTSGIRTDQFTKNPIGLFMHKRANRWDVDKDTILPICIWVNLSVEGSKLMAEPEFDVNDDFAMQIQSKVEGGFLRMASIGINPITTSSDPTHLLPGQMRETVVECELVEISIVDIGSNPNAIALYDKEQNLIQLNSDSEKVLIPLVKAPEQETNLISDMKNIAIKLGLSEAATEEQILAKITEIQGSLVTLNSQVETIQLASITSVVDQAVAEKRFTADKKDQMITLGKTSGIEILKSTIELMKPATKPTDHISGKDGKDGDTTITLASLYQEGIKAVEEFKAENPEEYAKLYKAHYGVEFIPTLEG